MSFTSGLAWGLGGFIAFFAAPSLGILPQLPGVAGAALESRQFWWVATVLCTGTGLFLAHAPQNPLAMGWGCGTYSGPALFLEHLKQMISTWDTPLRLRRSSRNFPERFLLRPAVSSLVMWLVVGSCTGLGLHRFLSKET